MATNHTSPGRLSSVPTKCQRLHYFTSIDVLYYCSTGYLVCSFLTRTRTFNKVSAFALPLPNLASFFHPQKVTQVSHTIALHRPYAHPLVSTLWRPQQYHIPRNRNMAFRPDNTRVFLLCIIHHADDLKAWIIHVESSGEL